MLSKNQSLYNREKSVYLSMPRSTNKVHKQIRVQPLKKWALTKLWHRKIVSNNFVDSYVEGSAALKCYIANYTKNQGKNVYQHIKTTYTKYRAHWTLSHLLLEQHGHYSLVKLLVFLRRHDSSAAWGICTTRIHSIHLPYIQH